MKRILSMFMAAFMLFCGCATDSDTQNVNINEATASAYSAHGIYTVEDLIVLQDYLLCRRTTGNGKNFDLNNDGRWDVFDLCLLRRELIKNQESGVTYESFNIAANGTVFTAKFADNPSADAFRELLKNGDITINMHDYGSFEKVGDIGTTLPRNDEKITTEPGDVILYQGNSITVYYDKNTWNFTRLGKIENVTKEQLLEAFGDGSVDITFSLERR